MSGRPLEIEDPTNRWFIHKISAALLPVAIRRGITPNPISVTGLLCGLMAALLYTNTPAAGACVLGFLCMIAWHVFDGLDGQVARATGNMTALGRLLDGLCDYGTFISVYLALGWSMQVAGNANWSLAVLSGIAHAVQSNFYEARRQAYILRLAGKRGLPDTQLTSGFRVEALYNEVQTLSLRWTRTTDDVLDKAGSHAVATYRDQLAPVVRSWALLGANGRTLAIFLFCLSPLGAKGYFLWEIIGLGLLTILLELRLRLAERRFIAHIMQDTCLPQFPARQ